MRKPANSCGFRGVYIDIEGIKHGYLFEGKFEESRTDFDEFIITPTFFNAHTHLGDSIAKDPPYMDLVKMVGPNGYKFQVLRSNSSDELRRAILEEIEIAIRSGTGYFLDFRESGMEGLKIVEGINRLIPLGRPRDIEEALKMSCFGFAMSSVRDHEIDLLFSLRRIASKRGIIFAIHAGEMNCEDVERTVELKPDLVVHMNRCPEMLRHFMEEGIPIVSCIRSNAFFDLLNPAVYRTLASYENWLLGTDNGMLFNPSMLEEMHFSALIVKNDWAIFRGAVYGFRIFEKKFKLKKSYIVFHRKWNFRNSKNILSTLVRRASLSDIEAIVEPPVS
jgi:cytosine/adenosine deaminase-related metal-dependent hydrolase